MGYSAVNHEKSLYNYLKPRHRKVWRESLARDASWECWAILYSDWLYFLWRSINFGISANSMHVPFEESFAEGTSSLSQNMSLNPVTKKIPRPTYCNTKSCSLWNAMRDAESGFLFCSGWCSSYCLNHFHGGSVYILYHPGKKRFHFPDQKPIGCHRLCSEFHTFQTV